MVREITPQKGVRSFRDQRCGVVHNLQKESLDPGAYQIDEILPLSDAIGFDRVPPAQVDHEGHDNRSHFPRGLIPASLPLSPSCVPWLAMDDRVVSRAGLGEQGSSEPEIPSSTGMESALVRAAIAGDRTALSDLLRVARRLAIGQALARTRDPEDSEDVAQEVLFRVLTKLPSFSFRSRFSSWVYRITENEIQNLFRRRTRVEKLKRLASFHQPNVALEPHVDTSLDVERLRDAVEGAVAGLPDLQGQPFRLVALHHLRPSEAARVLGKSQTNIRASLSRARVKIRERLLEKAPALVGDLR